MGSPALSSANSEWGAFLLASSQRTDQLGLPQLPHAMGRLHDSSFVRPLTRGSAGEKLTSSVEGIKRLLAPFYGVSKPGPVLVLAQESIAHGAQRMRFQQ